MARVKITEFRAKSLLLGEAYQGIPLGTGNTTRLPKSGRWVAKVDQGVKKRMKQGLVAVDISPRDIPKYLARWKKKGYSRFLAEPFFPHHASEERYLSLERVRDGLRLLYGAGGIDVETHSEAIQNFILRTEKDVSDVAKKIGVPETFLVRLAALFQEAHVSFFEINPLMLADGVPHALDAAALVDDAGMFFVRGAWDESDIVGSVRHHEAEERVAALQKTTPASLKLTVLNPDGALFFLLSGGGGSIVIADEAALLGVQKDIGNYGEYSGNPSREETYLYAKEILGLLLASKKKKKALVIAGGIANFTDVAATLAGVVDALAESAPQLRKQKIRVFVRRGGPNEREGLAHLRDFLAREKLLGSVHGSEAVITTAVDEAVRSIQS